MHVAERMTAVADAAGGADVRIAGPADAIYLALWNRGDEVEVAGEFASIDEALAKAPVPYEEWEVLYRQRLQVERDLRAPGRWQVRPS